MEKRDLYDESKNRLSLTINKGDDIPSGCFIIVVMIIMQNKEGEFLIQKRSESKGGRWAFTGGHPKSGESSLDGIMSEVKEELGIDLSKEKIILMKTNIFDNIIGDVYYVNMEFDLEKIVLQEDEVSDVKLVSYSEIVDMINHDLFHKSHGNVFIDLTKDEYCKKLLNML